MRCPACDVHGCVKWTPPVYTCQKCGHELTRREYSREVEGDWDRFLASPPEEAHDGPRLQTPPTQTPIRAQKA